MQSRTRLMLRAFVVALSVMSGSLMLATGIGLERWRSQQTEFYNYGIVAAATGNHPEAVASFDHSLAAYRRSQRAGWLERFVFPRPDTELAARASFYKGVVLISMQQLEPAVQALLESLRFNPGNGVVSTGIESRRLFEQALEVKHTLEVLLAGRPDLAYQQGAGRQSVDGSAQDRRVPGEDPGTMPGPGTRDAL